MSAWFLETGLYLLGVAVVPLVGLALVAWGLWGGRSKGRPRCPKCWYDMRGTVPRLVCPECGHAPGSERGLYRTRRRWRRIVVGAVLVLLSAYPLTIVGGWYKEQAVIRALGATAHVDTGCIGPDWLVDRLPDGYARFFERPRFAVVASDAELALRAKLPYLQSLAIYGTHVTDAGLVHLTRLSQLRGLVLSDTQVTDAGLVHLAGLPQLENLLLGDTQMTHGGIARLKRALPNVEVVRW